MPKNFSLPLNIVGQQGQINLDDGVSHLFFRYFFANFIESQVGKEPGISLDLKFNKPQDFLSKKREPDEINAVLAFKKNEQFEISSKKFKGKFNLKTLKGSAASESLYSLRCYVKICFALSLLKKGVLFIHSSGVEKKGKGILFLGPPGAGKTTIAQLTELSPLNDDINAIYCEEGKVWVASTPFGGYHVPTERRVLPLDKTFILNKAKKAACRVLSPDKALIKIMENELFNIITTPDDSLMMKPVVFKSLGEIVGKSKTCRLSFKKDKSFMPFL